MRAAITGPAGGGEEMAELPAPEAVPELESHVEEAPAAEAPPVAEPAPAPEPSAEPVTAATTQTPAAWVPPPAMPPPAMGRMGVLGAESRSGSGLALGIVLVVVGVFFLLMRLFEIDLSTYGWPLYVIIPGLTLVVVGFMSLGSGAIIPGAIVTVAGLILAYQNSTGDWATWSYAWALVVPGAVGLGIFLQGLRVHDAKQLSQGRNLMFWSLMIFLVGFVVFESIFNVSGIADTLFGRAALPALLIIIGITLLVRNLRRQQQRSVSGAPPAS